MAHRHTRIRVSMLGVSKLRLNGFVLGTHVSGHTAQGSTTGRLWSWPVLHCFAQLDMCTDFKLPSQ